MRVLSVLLFVPALAVAAGADKGPPAGWKEVTPKRGSYTASFPGGAKVVESEDSIVSPKFGQIRVFRLVQQRKDGSLFAAGQINLPPQLTKAPPKVRQNFFRDQALEELRGKLVEEKKASLGTMTGKEYLIQTPRGMARYRVLGTGVLIYRVLVAGTKEQVNSKDAETFFELFKRKPPSAK